MFGIHQKIAVLAFAALILGGCSWIGSTYTETDNTPQSPAFVRMAPEAPPPSMAEYAPRPADPMAATWRPGYWVYNGSSFEWVPGDMIARPAPTAVWSADHWARRRYGWVFVPGYWQ